MCHALRSRSWHTHKHHDIHSRLLIWNGPTQWTNMLVAFNCILANCWVSPKHISLSIFQSQSARYICPQWANIAWLSHSASFSYNQRVRLADAGCSEEAPRATHRLRGCPLTLLWPNAWLTHCFHTGVAANRPAKNRRESSDWTAWQTFRAAVRCMWFCVLGALSGWWCIGTWEARKKGSLSGECKLGSDSGHHCLNTMQGRMFLATNRPFWRQHYVIYRTVSVPGTHWVVSIKIHLDS